MRRATDLWIHGSVSHSLLQNLEEFQAAWSCWRPGRYQPVNVVVDEEVERGGKACDMALAAFSGGLDSCFSVWRHTQGHCGRRTRNLKAALMIHGFDIPLHEPDVYSRAAKKSRAMVESAGLDFIPMACNYREFGGDWEQEHGAALASCLSLLSKGYSTGLIAASHVYSTLLFPWGSNPLTDPMLSSDTFAIVYDSAEFSRVQKAKGVSEWEEAMSFLRVCWQGQHKDQNCGSCLRCIATALCFAAMHIKPPACLNVPSLEEGIKTLRSLKTSPVAVTRLEEILDTAKESLIQDSWPKALEQCIRLKRRQGNRCLADLKQRTNKLLRHAVGPDAIHKAARFMSRG
jgi:hypothetical protein